MGTQARSIAVAALALSETLRGQLAALNVAGARVALARLQPQQSNVRDRHGWRSNLTPPLTTEAHKNVHGFPNRTYMGDMHRLGQQAHVF